MLSRSVFEMDKSQSEISIVLRVGIMMEKAVASLRTEKPKGNREARDWCVRSLTLLDLLNSADPANCIRGESSANKETCLLQLMTAATTIENILLNLSAADKSALDSREQYTVQLRKDNKDSRNAGVSDDSNSKYAVVSKTAPISFNEVVGNMEAKQALYENVVLPLTISDLTKARVFSGIRAGSGNVMLYGPAGTGKTIMCQAAAFEARAELIIVRPSDVLSKYHGESERYLRGVFEKARTIPRAIIFFDEFDAIAAARGDMDDSMSSRRLLAELLLQLTEQKQIQAQEAKALSSKLAYPPNRTDSQTLRRRFDGEDENAGASRKCRRTVNTRRNVPAQDCSRSHICIDIEAEQSENRSQKNKMHPSLDGELRREEDIEAETRSDIESEEGEGEGEGEGGHGVVVIAATNRLEDIDPAVVRRFESRVYVGVPDHDTRVVMIATFIRGLESLLTDQDLDAISSSTAGWSGSEIETLCREAAMAPVRAVWGFCPSTTTATAAAVTDSQHPQLHRSPSRHSPSSTAQGRLNAVSADRVRAKDLTKPIRAIVLNDFYAGIDVMMRRGSDVVIT